jgi:hypothetical protein
LGRGEGGEEGEEDREKEEMHLIDQWSTGDGDGTVTMWFLAVGGGN